MIWLANADKYCYWFNKERLRFTGRTLDQEKDNGWTQDIHPDDLQSIFDGSANSFDRREPFLSEYRLRRHDGEYRWIMDFGSPVHDEGGNFLGYSGMCFDIHDRKLFEEGQRQQKEFIGVILETIPECVTVASPTGELLKMNRAGFDLLEVETLEHFNGLGFDRFVHPAHRGAVQELHQRVLGGGRDTLEFKLISSKGKERWAELHAAPLHDKAGNVESIIAITRDVTERRTLIGRLEQQAQRDHLTNLLNRRHFFHLANTELSRIRRHGGTLSLLMFDVDRFKGINDQHGHQAGDLVLVRIAEICCGMLRDMDAIGRLGGEEFAVLLPETDQDQAVEVAQRLRTAIASCPILLPGGASITVTASFGVTGLVGDLTSLDALIHQADCLLYSAKESGRNCVVAGVQPSAWPHATGHHADGGALKVIS